GAPAPGGLGWGRGGRAGRRGPPGGAGAGWDGGAGGGGAAWPPPPAARGREHMSRLRVAILGAGFIADFRAQAYAKTPGAEVVAVLGRDPGRTRALAEKHGIPHHCTDYETLFRGPEFDVVDVCLPNHLHLEAVRVAAGARKHVICEKPLGRTAEEAREMLAAVEDAGVIHCYGENWVFSPDMVEVEARIGEGLIGRPLWLRGREGHFGPHSAWFYDK